MTQQIETEKTTYRIKDLHTNYFVGGEYQCVNRARRQVDKLDNEYGAYRYSVVTIKKYEI